MPDRPAGALDAGSGEEAGAWWGSQTRSASQIASREPALMRLGQHRIGGGLFGAVGEAGVAVLHFLGAELLDGLLQRLLVGSPSLLRLLAVMLVDHLLDRDGAGHRGSSAPSARWPRPARSRRRARADRAPRPRAALDHQALEGLQVLELLLVHMADHARPRARLQHRELAFVDPLRAVFAGVIDADDAVDQLLLGGSPGRRSSAVSVRQLRSSTAYRAARRPRGEPGEQSGVDRVIARHGDAEEGRRPARRSG